MTKNNQRTVLAIWAVVSEAFKHALTQVKQHTSSDPE